ncbi:32 kDa beta-galactoside-binding lectin-like isoform X1 [Styela clava]
MFVGKTIYVYGESHKDDKGRIAVNLLCGPDEDDQIALHVNPRFDQKTVVINTRDSQGWGKEERDKKFSLKKPGKPFAIWIVCLKEHFEIFINRNEVFATYKHRIPLKLITHVQVEQNCDIKLICSGIEGQNVPVGVLDGHAVPLDIDVPFFNIRSHSFTIYGKPTNSDSRFDVNLRQGDKIHFHYSPRLNEREIVRNTLDKKWETEERDLDFPFLFAKDVPFTVKIIVEKHGFDVDINGIAAFTYNKRIGPLKDIRNISVNGDVELIKMVIS